MREFNTNSGRRIFVFALPGHRGTFRSVSEHRSKRLKRGLVSWCAVHDSGLAVSRRLLGLIVACDMAVRLRFASAFYAANSLVPCSAVSPRVLGTIFCLSPSLLWPTFLLATALALGLVVAVGPNSRLSLGLAFGAVVAVHARNPLVLHAGDTLLAISLLWHVLIPGWGISEKRTTANLATLGLLAQLIWMYFAATHTREVNPWQTGQALSLALRLGDITTAFGHWFGSAHGAVLRALTRSTFCLEAAGVFLACVPRLRPYVAGAFVVLHLGIALCFRLGAFPYVCIAAWLPFIPFAKALDQLAFGNWVDRPWPLARAPRVLSTSAVAVAIIWCLRNPLAAVPQPGAMVAVSGNLASLLDLRQEWGLFNVAPGTTEDWPVAIGRIGEREVDLIAATNPPRFDAPVWSAIYPATIWHPFVSRVMSGSYPAGQWRYLDYLVRRWNGTHKSGDQVGEARLYGVSRSVTTASNASTPALKAVWPRQR